MVTLAKIPLATPPDSPSCPVGKSGSGLSHSPAPFLQLTENSWKGSQIRWFFSGLSWDICTIWKCFSTEKYSASVQCFCYYTYIFWSLLVLATDLNNLFFVTQSFLRTGKIPLDFNKYHRYFLKNIWITNWNQARNITYFELKVLNFLFIAVVSCIIRSNGTDSNTS